MLKASNLPTLKYRRYRGDMIELFKMIRCKLIYDPTRIAPVDFMDLPEDFIRTRSNKYKLVHHHCHCDLRKFNFTNWVIRIWNSLSNHVSADIVNSFNKTSAHLISDNSGTLRPG